MWKIFQSSIMYFKSSSFIFHISNLRLQIFIKWVFHTKMWISRRKEHCLVTKLPLSWIQQAINKNYLFSDWSFFSITICLLLFIITASSETEYVHLFSLSIRAIRTGWLHESPLAKNRILYYPYLLQLIPCLLISTLLPLLLHHYAY